jgi:hypothetical protein
MKQKCKITRQQFHDGAKPITIRIGSQEIHLNPREFATGSFGWRADGKFPVDVNGTAVMATLNLNLITLGSKDTQ